MIRFLVFIFFCLSILVPSPARAQNDTYSVITAQNADQLQVISTFGDGRITTRAWSDDGRVLALATVFELRIYSQDGIYTHPTTMPISTLAVSPDNRLVAYIEEQKPYSQHIPNIMVIWDIEKDEIITQFQYDYSHINSMKFLSSNIMEIALAQSNGDGQPISKIIRWDSISNRVLFIRDVPFVSGLASISPDSTRIATTGSGSSTRTGRSIGYLQVDDIETGQPLISSTILDDGTYTRMVWHPHNHDILVTAGFGGVRIWNVLDENEMFALGTKVLMRDVIFNDDGSQLATVDDQNIVRLWDSSTGALLAIYKDQPYWIRKLALVDNTVMALGDDTIWNPISSEVLNHFTVENTSNSFQLGQFIDDTTALIIDSQGKAFLWNFDTAEFHSIDTLDATSDDQFLMQDNLLIKISNAEKTLTAWDVRNLDTPFTQLTYPDYLDQVANVHYVRQSDYFLVYGRAHRQGSIYGGIEKWYRDGKQEVLRDLSRTHYLASVGFNPSGNLAIYHDADWQSSLDNLETEVTFPIPTRGDYYTFSPDGKWVAIDNYDANFRLVNLTRPNAQPYVFSEPYGYSEICFSAANDLLLATNVDNVDVFDLVTSKELTQLTHHLDPVKDIAFSPNGQFLLLTSFDGTATLWGVGQ